MVTALALTVVIEAACAFGLGVRSRNGQLIVLLANIITNPLLNCVLTAVSFYISPGVYYYFLVPLEIIVVIAEGAIYRGFLPGENHPFRLSLILNACSYFLGTGILYIIRH